MSNKPDIIQVTESNALTVIPPNGATWTDARQYRDANDATALELLRLAIERIEPQQPADEMARQICNAAAFLLENTDSLQRAKKIRDQLQRAQLLFEQYKASLFATNQIVAQRIRTEWNIGDILTRMPREKGGVRSDDKKPLTPHEREQNFLVKLESMGIPRHSAYRWQQLARIDPVDLDQFFEMMDANREEISAAAVMRYFIKHPVVDTDDGSDPPDQSSDEAIEQTPELPPLRQVNIVCKHCGTMDTYDIPA